MDVRLVGRFIDVNDEQLLKASAPMDVTLSGILIVVMGVPLNAAPPILTNNGFGSNVTDVSDVYPSNAEPPIAVITSPPIVTGIVRLATVLSLYPVIVPEPFVVNEGGIAFLYKSLSRIKVI